MVWIGALDLFPSSCHITFCDVKLNPKQTYTLSLISNDTFHIDYTDATNPLISLQSAHTLCNTYLKVHFAWGLGQTKKPMRIICAQTKRMQHMITKDQEWTLIKKYIHDDTAQKIFAQIGERKEVLDSRMHEYWNLED